MFKTTPGNRLRSGRRLADWAELRTESPFEAAGPISRSTRPAARRVPRRHAQILCRPVTHSETASFFVSALAHGDGLLGFNGLVAESDSTESTSLLSTLLNKPGRRAVI